MNETYYCPLCSAPASFTLYERSGVPVQQHQIMPTARAAREIARGTLHIMLCDYCGFVFNASFEPGKVSYDEHYDNAQQHSAFFSSYLDELVHHLVHERGIHNANIIEIGCGSGDFLRRMVMADSSNRGYGFDPAYSGPENDLNGRLTFRQQRFTGAASIPQTDAVICRHVIEHIADPAAFLRTIKSAVTDSPRARLYFETPDLNWILENTAFWDFFYEHCSYFTPASLSFAFESAGFRVDALRLLFDQQYMWLEASLNAKDRFSTQPAKSEQLLTAARTFARSVPVRLEAWRTKLQSYTRQGGVALWGAGAKGVTFANLIDPQAELLQGVVDLNPHKQGNYLPGTGHPIFSLHQAAVQGIRTLLIMNPNYLAESAKLLRELDSDISLVALE
ncbi:MAG: class I SAM-dependent methyltransferase [Anaerolineae bacterium]